MACYVFYDSDGKTKEFVNSPVTMRQGSTNSEIYFYFDKVVLNDIQAINFSYEKADGTKNIISEYTQEIRQVPYDPNRRLYYFRYYTDYVFVKLILPEESRQILRII